MAVSVCKYKTNISLERQLSRSGVVAHYASGLGDEFGGRR